MGTKTPHRKLALSSQTLISLALMSAFSMKKTRRWIMEGGIVQRKGWKTTMGIQLEEVGRAQLDHLIYEITFQRRSQTVSGREPSTPPSHPTIQCRFSRTLEHQ